MKPCIGWILGLGMVPALLAQTPTSPPPQFDVASIRPSASVNPQQVNIGLHLDGSQARISALSVKDYVAMAYRTKSYQVNGPDWISSNRFDINATLPEGAATSQIPEMMRSLLLERFGLKIHRDKKDLPMYVLTRGKRPLALQKTSVEETGAGTVDVAASGSGQGVSVKLGGGAYYTFANNKFEGKKLNMATLVDSLSIYLNLPVIDETGLEGYFDVTLEITAEDYRAMLLHAASINGVVLPPQMQQMVDTATIPSLFDAFEKVGLKLESRKIAQDVIVVDEISSSPTEN